MIRVRYEREQYRLTADGHACSAPYGTDLVCAAVSILLHTLEHMTRKLESEGRAVCDGCLRMGFSSIHCLPTEGNEAVVHWVMDTVSAGLELLAEEFGEYVSYDEVRFVGGGVLDAPQI